MYTLSDYNCGLPVERKGDWPGGNRNLTGREVIGRADRDISVISSTIYNSEVCTDGASLSEKVNIWTSDRCVV